MYQGNYTTANKEKQSALSVRFNDPDSQGQVVFFRKRRKKTPLLTP